MNRLLETTGVELPVKIEDGLPDTCDEMRREMIRNVEDSRYIGRDQAGSIEHIGRQYLAEGHLAAALHVKELLQYFGDSRSIRRRAHMFGNAVHAAYSQTYRLKS